LVKSAKFTKLQGISGIKNFYKNMSNETHSHALPNWLTLTIFIAIMAALWIFGDLFTFILGLIIEAVVFAGAYDRLHGEH
jgi:hypothetical protein